MIRWIFALLLATTLLGQTACRRRVVHRPPPVSQLPAYDPTPSSAPAAPRAPAENTAQAMVQPELPPPVRPAVAPAPTPAAPAAPTATVSHPYQPQPDGTRLPMWRQRAKFY